MTLPCWLLLRQCELGWPKANDAGLLVATCHRCHRSRAIDLSDLPKPKRTDATVVPFRTRKARS